MSKKQITVPIFVPHLGCPHCCVFCNQWRVSSVKKQPDTASIEKTIKTYIGESRENVDRVELAFFGGTFTAINKKKQRELLDAVSKYIKAGLIDGIRISTRPDYIDNEILDLLSEFSVKTVELGVQSFDDSVLEMSNRDHSSDDVINAVKLLKIYGFRTGIQLMPGLPRDTFEKSFESAKKTVQLNPDDVRIYPSLVLRDTKMAKLYFDGIYRPLSIEDAVEVCSSMYGLFVEAGINVIRMGLHPFDIDDMDSVIAGPYHPAMGFLIKARYRRDILEKALISWFANRSITQKTTLAIPVVCREEYIGYNRNNITYLKKQYNLNKIEIFYENIDLPMVLS